MDLVFPAKTASTLKSNAIVAYPIHIVLLHFIPAFRRFLIDKGYTFAGLLSVQTSTDEHEEPKQWMEENQFEKDRYVVPVSHALPAPMGKDARIFKQKVLHDAFQEILEPFNPCFP